MKDHDRLHISPSDKRDLKILWDEMDRLQYQCKEKLLHNMTLTLPGTIIENLNRLQFEEDLTDSQTDRSTNVGVLYDDLLKFLRFKTSVKIMTESWSYEEAKTLSDQLDTFTSLMKRVLQKNGIRLQCSKELHDLKDRMDKRARTFVEFFEEECRNADGGRWVIAESDIDDVRNYVVLRTLHETLLLFDVDLGKLTE